MSSTISKIAGAIFSGSQETTIALASLNFDFSLVKLEAPLEFQGLGSALSTRRRDSAEEGLAHITARKLGALFEDIIPSVPTLIKAYGTRVSEIAASPHVNPQGTREDAFWSDHIGADGTTIWAAATSGNAAIAVHLLACMLARLWTGPQATSIWVEVVAERKKELAKLNYNESMSYSNLAAAQISISREQLRDWDASARSWLQSADKAKHLQQLQLMLILNNIKLPVNTSMEVYPGVLQAWKTALKTTEDLLNGMPQRAQDGAVLLGLSAWHIYPDMLVLGECATKVEQNDVLVDKGGIITIGVKSLSPDRDDGIFWSLPLAHLRYYGDPVPSSRSMAIQTSRIPFEDLLQIALGSACSLWSKGRYDINEAAQLVVSIRQYLQADSNGIVDSSKTRTSVNAENDLVYEIPEWFNLLFDAASGFLASSGVERESFSRLTSFGQRRGATFLAVSAAHPEPFFGLSNYGNLFKLMDGEEDWIAALRAIAKTLDAEPDDLIIRYTVSSISALVYEPHFEYATALAGLRRPFKQYQEGHEPLPHSHTRWILDPDDAAEKAQLVRGCACKIKCDRDTCACAKKRQHCTIACHRDQFRKNGRKFRCGNLSMTTAMTYQAALLEREGRVEHQGEQRRTTTYAEKSEDLIFAWDYEDFSGWPVAGPQDKYGNRPRPVDISFKILLGDPNTAAIFRRQDPVKHMATQFERMEHHSTLDMIFQIGLVRRDLLASYLVEIATGVQEEEEDDDSNYSQSVPPIGNLPGPYQPPTHCQYFYSLTALSVARRLYRQLPGSTVDIGVVTKPVYSMEWIPAVSIATKTYSLTKTQAFSCIALFETGGISLSPPSLEKVMAVSSSNSIFVAAALIEDPWISSDFGGIRRLVGNVGRPGLTLLVPPPNPRIRTLDLSSWGVINHNDFEGTLDDSFRSTSLHLSFTGYQLPVDTGIHGSRDGEAFFLESLVSVLDRGEWIADMDILGMVGNPKLYRVPRCFHNNQEAYDGSKMPTTALASIESWQEFLDPPRSACIVHALGNWYGRLATAAINVQRGNRTLLLPNRGRICWPCVYEHLKLAELAFNDGDDRTDDEIQRPKKRRRKLTNDSANWMVIP